MNKEFDLQEYMTKGVERVVKDAIKATIRDPKGSAFMMNALLVLSVRHKLFLSLIGQRSSLMQIW